MKKFYIYIILLSFASAAGYAQSQETKKADDLYARYAYSEAIEAYNKLIEKGKSSDYVYAQLGSSYAILGEYKKAVSFYKRAARSKDASPETIYAYAQALKANGEMSEYISEMKRYTSLAPTDPRAKTFTANPDYLDQLLALDPDYTVTNAATLNSTYSDYGGFVKDNKIYFASGRNTDRKKHALNDEPFLEIYSATIDGSTMGSPTLLAGDVNTKYHEGTVAISPDGKRMYFDRNDYFEGDLAKDDAGVNQINLYTADFTGGVWTNIQSVPFNSEEHSTGHPALSPDGKTLYYSSDKPGGKGGSDLYMVSVQTDGTFGTPQSLGDAINTFGTEGFPFIAADGTLYFSSNGHLGMGGLDVFSASAKGNSGFTSPKNMGPGINSPGDDFAISLADDMLTGFVSSNRSGGKGGDDIYILGQLPPCDIDVALTIQSTDGTVLENAMVVVANTTDGTSESDTATSKGKYLFNSECKREYRITASADGYETSTKTISVARTNVVQTINLKPIDIVEITPTEVKLDPIYFDFDKANIRPSAAAELDRLVEVMNKYPTMVISAESHTDKRGPESYNQRLSQRRADSMRDYVISRGIDESRITSIGKGESDLAVECGSTCTEEEHQLNRRSVFRIVSR